MYPILLNKDELENKLFSLVKDNTYFVIDEKVYYKFEYLFAKISFKMIMETKEEFKNKESLFKIIEKFLEVGLTRRAKVAVIGGGVLTDLIGFASSIYLRGIDCIMIPTTLTGMIDAAIGGKNGINLNEGKNLIGLIKLPCEIYLSTFFLDTLPELELRNGKGELLKTILLSKTVYDVFQREILEHNNKNNLKISNLKKTIFECAKFKTHIINLDLNETKGLREQLNLGHTLGHAIELSSNRPHGICVLIGIYLKLRIFNPKFLDQFYNIVNELDLMGELKLKFKINKEKFISLLSFDKKNISNEILRIILIEEIGNFHIKEVRLNELIKNLEEDEFFKSIT